MNSMKIPGSPNWYLSSVFTCASDNTIVYAATGNNINVIYPTDSSKPALIETTFRFHTKKIIALDINHSTWNNPQKLVATVGDDKYVKLLDLETKNFKKHTEHAEYQNDSPVSVSIAGDRVISVSENGVIVIWQPENSCIKRLHNIFGQKVKVTCMSTCPHAKAITAFGLAKGSIVIADLRNNGKILYKMTKHQESVIGLSWCPAPINIFHSSFEQKIIKATPAQVVAAENSTVISDVKIEISEAKSEISEVKSEVSEVKSEISESEKEENALKDTENIIEELTNIEVPKYGARKKTEYEKVDKVNPWANINYDDSEDEEIDERETILCQEKNFLQECQNLRKVILGDEDCVVHNSAKQNNQEDKENINVELLSEAMCSVALDDTLKNSEEIAPEPNDTIVSEIIPQKRFIKDENIKEYLLASTCIKGEICIWNTSNGRLQQKITTFTKKSKNKHSSQHEWSNIYWLKPDMLLTSSYDNKVHSVQLITGEELEKNPSKRFNSRLIHSDHNQRIFSIVCPYKLYTTFETTTLDSLKESVVWTSSKDRLIICTDLGSERKTLVSYPTFGSTITFMAVSLIDPTKLAIGLSDGVIRIWDLSLNQTNVVLMANNQEKNRQRIICLDWHPTKENILAYSTVEGQLGTINVKNQSNMATKFRRYHTKTIYKIQWAPFPFEEGVYGLYTSSGGELTVQREDKPHIEPMKIDIDNCHVTTFAWNEDYSLLAVGTREGQVKLLEKNFSIYETFYMQRKSVQCVQWHPRSTVNDSVLSPFANYLAVATNESNIYIYDCLHAKDKDANNSSKLVTILTGQTGSVKYLCWSPHQGENIVAMTDYGMANVYNVAKEWLISSNRCNTTSCAILWSPINKDLIISGNYGHTLTVWDLTQNRPIYTLNNEGDEKESKLNGHTKKDEDSDNSTNVDNLNKKMKKKQHTLERVTRLQKMNYVDLCKKLINLSSDDESDSSSENEDSPKPIQNAEPINPIQMFGSKKDALLLLHHEEMNHLRKSNWDQMITLGLWRGNAQKMIETAMGSGEITPLMIQVAPMISHQLYLELCSKYADKLCNEGNCIEASNYYLLCHKVLNAINALCDSNMFRDALMLAKCRLPAKDPIIKNIYERWAKSSIIFGNYEEAAHCYIKLNKHSEAGELLSKRANKEVLDVAAELAKRSGNNDLLNAINMKLESFNRVEPLVDTPVLHVCESRLAALTEKLSNEEIDSNQADEDKDV